MGAKKLPNMDECTPIPPRLNLQQYAFVHYHKGAFANTQQQGRGEIEGLSVRRPLLWRRLANSTGLDLRL